MAAHKPAPKTAPKIVRRRAWDPALLELHEVSAIKAMAAAHPNAFDCVVKKICRFYEVSFAAGGDDGRRESDYAEGKRAVGKNLLEIVAMTLPTPGRGAPPADLPNSPTPAPQSAASKPE